MMIMNELSCFLGVILEYFSTLESNQCLFHPVVIVWDEKVSPNISRKVKIKFWQFLKSDTKLFVQRKLHLQGEHYGRSSHRVVPHIPTFIYQSSELIFQELSDAGGQ